MPRDLLHLETDKDSTPNGATGLEHLLCTEKDTWCQSPSLVGEGPSNREVGGSQLCWAIGRLLTMWSFVTCGGIGGHQRGAAWQTGGKRVPCAVGEGCISVETAAHCQNPGRGLDTAQASWDGDTPGSDMGSKQQKRDL